MKKFLALTLALVMVLSLAACGSKEPGNEDSKDGKRYAVILKTKSTDFWMSVWKGVEQYAKDNNLNVDLYASTSDTDYEGQVAILENCINSGKYDGIAIAPCSGVNMISGVVAANKAGITIVNIDEQFDVAEMKNQGAVCSAYVSSDNVAIGHLGAEYLSSKLEKGSQVAVVEGIAGNPSSEDRASGAKAAFKEAGMEVVAATSCDWDMQKALDTVTAWITQFPDLKAIYCCNDGMAAGVRQALANAGKTNEILLCGTDGDSDAVEAVEAGNMAATVAQDPSAIGATGLKLLVDAVEHPDKYTPSAAPEKSPVDAVLVKKD